MSSPDYKGFAKWCLTEGPWAGCDLDGGGVQDAAIKFGIAKQVQYDPEVHGPTDIDPELSDTWFVMVDDK